MTFYIFIRPFGQIKLYAHFGQIMIVSEEQIDDAQCSKGHHEHADKDAHAKH